MITPDNKRLLFYADATEQNTQNLDLNSLLTSLRSNYFPGFEQQIFFIDACANYVMDWRLYGTLPVQTFPRGDPLTTHEQFVCLAAKPGEYAKNVTEQQTGLFSQLVLEELAKQGSDRWPPDMELLTISLTERFDKLHADSIAKQTPTHFWYKNWDGTERLFGDINVLAFPRFWNVPYLRNPYFTGREDMLVYLRENLTRDKAAALKQPQAISGLGGIGKTQIAVEYAYRYQAEYSYIFWVNASTREDIIVSLLEIVELLQLPQQQEQNQDKVVRAVKAWWNTHSRWLLIFDNAEDLTLLADYFPVGNQGHLLITTRDPVSGVFAQSLEVEKMDEQEALLLLLRRANLLALDASVEHASLAERQVAKQIVLEMDGLPLALDQAGAYIEEMQCSLEAYLKRYRNRRVSLLKRRGRNSTHPEPVATTWSLSFQQVGKLNTLAADLLRCCAFLAPDAIPEQLMIRGAPELGSIFQHLVDDPGLLDEALGTLRRYSLVKRQLAGQTFSVHRLVQAVLFESLEEAVQRLWAERTVRAVSLAFPDVTDVKLWEQCERFLPHARVCATLIEEYTFEFDQASNLLNQMAYYLERRAQYTQAEPLYQRALAICEKQLGPEHHETAICLDNLANVYREQRKYEQAVPLTQRALAIFEKQLGPEHHETATCLDNLAGLYREQRKYEQAEPLFQRALMIREKWLSPEHPSIANSLNNLAELNRAKGKYKQAEPLFQRALMIREKWLGPEHLLTVQSLDNLALLYDDQGRYGEAERLFQRALTIKEKQLEPEHPSIANSLNHLALLYDVQGKYKQAEPLYQRALAISKKELGPEHPSTVTIRENYNALVRKMKRKGKGQR